MSRRHHRKQGSSQRSTPRYLSPWFPGQRVFDIVTGEFMGIVEYVEFNNDRQEYCGYVPDTDTAGWGLLIGDEELEESYAIGQRGEVMSEAQIEAEYEAMVAEQFKGYVQ